MTKLPYTVHHWKILQVTQILVAATTIDFTLKENTRTMNKYVHYLLVWVWVLPAFSQAQVINEVMMNPPSSDDGQEFIEIKGAAGASLSGIHLLCIDGDGGQAGVIDQALDLSTYTLGANGLLLIRDDASVLNPAPDADTNVEVQNFSPDIENGSNTFMVVTGYTGAVSDVDTNNDGVLDATPWTSVLDAVGMLDGTPVNNHVYADQVGGMDLPNQAAFIADYLFRSENNGNWYYGDITGSTSPIGFVVNEMADASGTIIDISTQFDFTYISPGGSNPLDLAAPLPVELLGFYLQGATASVQLSWATATEKENAGWEVQRSTDGRIWTSLGYVNGAGESQDILEYSYEDRYPQSGISYYRLKQLDFDGTFTFTDVRVIEWTEDYAKVPFSVFPNPATEVLKIKSEPGLILMISLDGRLVKSVEATDLITQVDIQDLAPGMYVLQVQGKFGDWVSTSFVKDGFSPE